MILQLNLGGKGGSGVSYTEALNSAGGYTATLIGLISGGSGGGSIGTLSYYGTAANLSEGRHSSKGTHVGDYGLFIGGYDYNWTLDDTVDAYNSSLVHSMPTAFSYAAANGLGAATLGNYTLLTGGENYTSTVVAYDTSLTRINPTGLTYSGFGIAGINTEDYILFGGGTTSSSSHTAIVTTYNSSLTRSTATDLSQSRRDISTSRVGDYALFGGGGYGTNGGYYSNTVDAYNNSLTRSVATSFTLNKRNSLSGYTDNYSFFAGGYTSESDYVADGDVYSTSLTHSILTNLSDSYDAYTGASASLNNHVLFYGVDLSNAIPSNAIIDVYNNSLVKTNPFSPQDIYLAGATIITNKYILFGGGMSLADSGIVDTVNVYEA